MGVDVHVGEPQTDRVRHIRTRTKKGDGKCMMFAFRKDRILIGVHMFGMPLREVWDESQTLFLSRGGICKGINYTEVFDPTGPTWRHGLHSRDSLEVRRSDWILTSAEHSDILAGRTRPENRPEFWNIGGRVSIGFNRTIVEANPSMDRREGRDFVVWCDPGDCPDLTQIKTWLDSRLRTVECYEYAVDRLGWARSSIDWLIYK